MRSKVRTLAVGTCIVVLIGPSIGVSPSPTVSVWPTRHMQDFISGLMAGSNTFTTGQLLSLQEIMTLPAALTRLVDPVLSFTQSHKSLGVGKQGANLLMRTAHWRGMDIQHTEQALGKLRGERRLWLFFLCFQPTYMWHIQDLDSPDQEVKPGLSTLEVQSPNHWQSLDQQEAPRLYFNMKTSNTMIIKELTLF